MINKPKLSVKLYKDENKQMKFLMHFILTFRLLPETVAELFGFSVEAVYDMIHKNASSYIGFDYLFNHEFPDQERAKAEALQFYSELLNAIKVKNRAQMTELLNYLFDSKALDLARTRQKKEALTVDVIETTIRYQLKYGLSQVAIMEIFNLNRRSYQPKVTEFLEQFPDLKRRYEYLADFLVSMGGRK
ncbi:MAG: hypothetical protein E7161_04620 [Firmicutes bacterium]|nr:hypothetical protein [Bacillota bacterium]